MYGRSSRYRPPGGGGGWPQRPPAPPPPPQPQYPNFAFQNSNTYLQPHNHNFPHPGHNFPPQFSFQNPGFPPQNQNFHQNPKETIEQIERAVSRAHKDLLAAGDFVTAWKVAQAALLILQVDSWNSLGVKFQEVPTLHRLLNIEGKVIAFIHCYVAVRRISSLYDLEVAICKNEGVKHFDELELGPFLQHPLVVHYFLVNSDVTEVIKLTSEDIINHLFEFTSISNNKISVEEFLNFVAKKRSITHKERLGLRIQNLGMYISVIQEARKLEDAATRNCLRASMSKLYKKFGGHPRISTRKRDFNERFSSISHRVESFASTQKEFCGTHIRFDSTSSDDESSDDGDSEDENIILRQSNPSSQRTGDSDRGSRCPYPSAIEEMKRLGLRGERHGSSSLANGNIRNSSSSQPKKKRKTESPVHFMSAISKLTKKEKVNAVFEESDIVTGNACNKNKNDGAFSIANDSLKMFITTWKESCMGQTVGEVFERMLNFYDIKPRQRKKTELIFLSYPFIGLLNVAVSSVKHGMWDSIYDTFQAIHTGEFINTNTDKNSDIEKIDIGSSIKNESLIPEKNADHRKCIPAEDIIRKIRTYFDLDCELNGRSKSSLQYRIKLLRKICDCESWLAEQFCLTDFSALDQGNFFEFLEKNASFLPDELHNFLVGPKCNRHLLEACMLSNQLTVQVSQALSCLWGDEVITEQMISLLLLKQYPSIGFDIKVNGSLEDLEHNLREHKNGIISNRVLFSSTLVGNYHVGDSLAHAENNFHETTADTFLEGQGARAHETLISKNAIDMLLHVPMLSDLGQWLHWDLNFAPMLGPLVPWLLNEVNMPELLCLVTKDGKVIRIDQSATVDSLWEAVLKLSSFHTVLNLLSLNAMHGGEKHVKLSLLSLLKCDACRAFEIIWENLEVDAEGNCVLPGEMFGVKMFKGISTSGLTSDLCKSLEKKNKVVSVMSKYVLDCLDCVPAEFRGFAAEVLLSGMQSVYKDAASSVLHECNKIEHRLMLHDVGLSLDIVEWLEDYNAFRCTDLTLSLDLKAAKTEANPVSNRNKDILDMFPSQEGNTVASQMKDRENCSEIRENTNEITDYRNSDSCFKLDENEDAVMVIESIRRDEFGLDPGLSNSESNMLKKQHARLGRALHCLSQELYSQDSHFLLELVQNADDNDYPENVEPTLTFILQETGIIVLNNERGFLAHNVRALCDVGKSTKKGCNAGYIGNKGIGFKSVFCVTDAPEIHSNGFHVKFDISEGQIGFVLPTIVPPCNVDLFSRMVSSGSDLSDNNFWNTCIVLPFRSQVSNGSLLNSIISMFSDLQPSLLLFLHRLKCIKFRNLLNDTLTVMKKKILGDGIVNVSHGRDKMSWFVASKKLQGNSIRSDVRTTDITMAFTLKETDNGYSPLLAQQPVFAFLPLRTYGLKFILQGDFVLPSSREEVDGNNPWNQWLLSEYPGLFYSAERDFCALPCFGDNPAKAVSAFLSFVPLVGEVHGFFSSLPRLIISKLRMSNCLYVEGDGDGWAPPCKVLKGWDEEVRYLLPDSLLLEHLGLRYLHKDIVLSASLSRTLGVEEYGPNILLRMMSSLCTKENGLISMGLTWLAHCINSVYKTLYVFPGIVSMNSEKVEVILRELKKIPFIPLSDGTFTSVNEGSVWLHTESVGNGNDAEHKLEYFPNLCGKLRTLTPSLLSASVVDASSDVTLLDNVTRMLHTIGVLSLSAHEIVKQQILPALCDGTMTDGNRELMTEYICFTMVHLKSTCPSCCTERGQIVSEIRSKASLLTNYGFKRPADTPLHFSGDFGNPVNINLLMHDVDVKWHEVDISYLNHPANKSISGKLIKWREFFQEIGITDFVQVVQVEKSIASMADIVLKNVVWDRGLLSPEAVAIDWESSELEQLLSLLSRNGKRESCKYLLEVLDMLWDTCYIDKTKGYFNSKSGDGSVFRSSFMNSICDSRWVASSIDDELHCPKDLFYDCDAVRMILGADAPYGIPKVKSERLASDIGFKTLVTLGDILEMLRLWRKSESPIKASLLQMSKLYSFIWKEMGASRQRIMEELDLGPFIFSPISYVSRDEDVVYGSLLSPQEVYWQDSTIAVDQMNQCGTSETTCFSIVKTLSKIYPRLHDFFVDECRVSETPPLLSYLQILMQLSTISIPSKAASTVFQVFLKWVDGLKLGLLSSEDIIHLKETLSKPEFSVLPTVQDKWVSLHPSFGLICWCDNEKLEKQFKRSDKIAFLYFGELNVHEKEIVQTNVFPLLRKLGIPALSEVVVREAIYHDLTDCALRASLINWALPYAQRYLYKLHANKYAQLKLCGFDTVKGLTIVGVKKLYYRNVIKSHRIRSTTQVECSCILQDNVLYNTEEADSHTLFMELSRLFFEGTPELQMANFLHMLTTMAESEASEDQIEFFIQNNQRVLELPDDESIWSLSSVSSVTENDKLHKACFVTVRNEQSSSNKRAGISSNWPRSDWKTAPGFYCTLVNGCNTQAAQTSSTSPAKKDDISEEIVTKTGCTLPLSINCEQTIKDECTPTSVEFVTLEYKNFEDQSCQLTDQNLIISGQQIGFPGNSSSGEYGMGFPAFCQRDQLQIGTPAVARTIETGKLGELLAFEYFVGRLGKASVEWVNQNSETGLPYDIIVKEQNGEEYIEVKATRSARKDHFEITANEWQFAIDKGERFSIARVVLMDNRIARVLMFKNPVKLCQSHNLQLVLRMPQQLLSAPAANLFSVD